LQLRQAAPFTTRFAPGSTPPPASLPHSRSEIRVAHNTPVLCQPRLIWTGHLTAFTKLAPQVNCQGYMNPDDRIGALDSLPACCSGCLRDEMTWFVWYGRINGLDATFPCLLAAQLFRVHWLVNVRRVRQPYRSD